MLRFRKSRFQLKTPLRPCLIIFRPPIPCPLSASSRVFSSLLFSHSLSGRAICEEPVRLNPTPAEASSSSGYNSEWISISSGHLITLRNCVRVPPPLFWCCHLCVTAHSCVGLAFACSLGTSAWQEWTRTLVCELVNYSTTQFSISAVHVRKNFSSRLQNLWSGVSLNNIICLFVCHTDIGTFAEFCFSQKSHVTTDINCAFLVAMWLFEQDVRIKKWEGKKRWILMSSPNGYTSYT